MATGWAHEGAVQEQIDATVKDAVERAQKPAALRSWPFALRQLQRGNPRRAREAIPGVRLCIACQEITDKEQSPTVAITVAAARTASCAEGEIC